MVHMRQYLPFFFSHSKFQFKIEFSADHMLLLIPEYGYKNKIHSNYEQIENTSKSYYLSNPNKVARFNL